MRRFFTLFGREVSHYFHQPLAYVVLFFFLIITGFNFQAAVSFLNNQQAETTIVEAFFLTPYFWLPFILILPLLTMRLFSEEYKLGTMEPLMTAPVRDIQVLLAKYAGALFFYCVLWAPSFLYFVIFGMVTQMNAAGAAGSYLGAYVMLLMLGMLYLAIGCLASALTSNQIVAAVIAFALCLLSFFMDFLSYMLLRSSPALREIIYYFSAIEHMMDYCRGVFDTRPVVFYLSTTAFVLFLAYHVFQYRRWKT